MLDAHTQGKYLRYRGATDNKGKAAAKQYKAARYAV